MLLSPAPAPIVRQEIIRRGLDGLNDADLVIVAHALMAAGGRREDELLDQVTERLERDRLMEAVIELRARRAVRASPHSIDEDAAWAQASYWVRGRTGYRHWHRVIWPRCPTARANAKPNWLPFSPSSTRARRRKTSRPCAKRQNTSTTICTHNDRQHLGALRGFVG
jgi:hypothetical protein